MTPYSLVVTGGTGLAGSNIALAAVRAGWQVRVLVRDARGTEPLQQAGARIAEGDVTDTDSLERAFAGAEAVIHAAAALGGTWSTVQAEEFWAVNHQGTLNVLDASRRVGVARNVVIDTHSILDPGFTHTERSPLFEIHEVDSQYVRAKRAAYYGAAHRAAMGQHIMFVTPGAIFGSGPLVQRTLHPTSFTNVLLRALRGEIESYLRFPMLWTYVHDLVQVCLRALERGEIGRRYLALGRNEDVRSLPEFCNRAAELAGVDARVRPIDPNAPDAPNIGTMRQFALRRWASPAVDCSHTTQVLGVAPTPVDDALRATIAWLREQRLLPPLAPAAQLR